MRVCLRVFSTLAPQSNEDKRFMKVDAGAKLEGVWEGGGGCDTSRKYESSGLAGRIIGIGRVIKDLNDRM